MFVPVVDKYNKPLMPTKPSRSRRWIKSGKATPFWKRGIFCIRLNVEPSAQDTQPIACGIDPGSKKEALTVKSKTHTYLNLQADAVDWVKDAVETRRNMRRGRRFRKTPCRKPRPNRLRLHSRSGIPPSTKARWQWKLRLCLWLRKIFPITDWVVEDVKATTQSGKRRWNASFSPLEVGKQWFYAELSKLGQVHLLRGYQTKALRKRLGLKKIHNKLSESFFAHCVDSWVLAHSLVEGVEGKGNGKNGKADTQKIKMLLVVPIRLHRRQLHALQPAKGSIRRSYGGTGSMGLKRGSYVKHPKYGICFVGGASKGRISLHSLARGLRLTQCAKPKECRFLTYASFRTRRKAAFSPP